MSPKSSRNTKKSACSGQIPSASPAANTVPSNNTSIRVQKANMCRDCVIISPDVSSPTQKTRDTRIFREVLEFDTLREDDWILDITLEKCPQDARYQQQLQQVIDLKDAEITDLITQSNTFRIYNILCEALRFCGDKVILPGVKDANKNNGKKATFLERFEDWTQVTQFLRRSPKIRDEDQRWLQGEINKVVESKRFHMWTNEWHELFNLKLPRDQAVHAAITLGDLEQLFINAHIFGDNNKKLIETLVRRMHRSIPKDAYATVSTASGLLPNPNWPRI